MLANRLATVLSLCLISERNSNIIHPQKHTLNSRHLQAQGEEEGELQKVVSSKQKAAQAATPVAYWPHMQWATSSWIVKPDQLFAICDPV